MKKDRTLNVRLESEACAGTVAIMKKGIVFRQY